MLYYTTMHLFTVSQYSKPYIWTVHVFLAVTCYLHFWQNDWDLLRATAATRGWNRYQNNSQHRKLTLEKKILPPLLPGLEPTTFCPFSLSSSAYGPTLTLWKKWHKSRASRKQSHSFRPSIPNMSDAWMTDVMSATGTSTMAPYRKSRMYFTDCAFTLKQSRKKEKQNKKTLKQSRKEKIHSRSDNTDINF